MKTKESTDIPVTWRHRIDALGRSPYRDAARVNRLKEKIGQGRYTVNSTRVAEKLLVFEIALLVDPIK
jgi:anti-sigma28 factor (negative regulator of flagellin synthesis)